MVPHLNNPLKSSIERTVVRSDYRPIGLLFGSWDTILQHLVDFQRVQCTRSATRLNSRPIRSHPNKNLFAEVPNRLVSRPIEQPSDRPTWKVKILQCFQMLQRKLQKSNHHTQTHPSQRKKQSTRTAIRSAYRPTGQLAEWTVNRTVSRPIDQLSDPPTLVFRFTHCLSLYYQTIQANSTLKCSLQSINHCEYTRSLFAFSTFGCYIRYLF